MSFHYVCMYTVSEYCSSSGSILAFHMYLWHISHFMWAHLVLCNCWSALKALRGRIHWSSNTRYYRRTRKKRNIKKCCNIRICYFKWGHALKKLKLHHICLSFPASFSNCSIAFPAWWQMVGHRGAFRVLPPKLYIYYEAEFWGLRA